MAQLEKEDPTSDKLTEERNRMFITQFKLYQWQLELLEEQHLIEQEELKAVQELEFQYITEKKQPQC